MNIAPTPTTPPLTSRTKTLTYWVDLWPGWQDTPNPFVPLNQSPNQVKAAGTRRAMITVEMPCYGGSADTDYVVQAKVLDLK